MSDHLHDYYLERDRLKQLLRTRNKTRAEAARWPNLALAKDVAMRAEHAVQLFRYRCGMRNHPGELPPPLTHQQILAGHVATVMAIPLSRTAR